MRLNPNISVDCVMFGFDMKRLNVLLVERSIPEQGINFIPDFTLAGNHIYENEDIDEAADRIVKSLTGIKNIYLEQFQAFAHPERLSRKKDRIWLKYLGYNPDNRVITVAYYALIDHYSMRIQPSGRKVEWFPIDAIPDLAFDHKNILMTAMESLRSRMQLSPVGFQLLPPKFTLSQLQTLYETVYDTSFDKRNFRKKVLKLRYIIALDEKQTQVSHKPARLYRFSRQKYEVLKKEFFDFTP
jgi:hypothetical protein